MRCIFYGDRDRCYAGSLPATIGNYSPDNEILTKYCETETFRECPRYLATIEFLSVKID
jgi:hypothetical protein